jgi:preprotein translocase subunit SecB
MSETSATAPNPDSQAPQGLPIRILGQYIRDLSFEVPHAPGIFGELRKQAPEIPVSFDVAMQPIQGSVFEVTLAVSVNATVGDKPAFILELAYATTVELDESVIPEDQLHPVLLIEVPRFVFPFVRQVIGDMTTSGGFPPLFLQPMDFTDMYTRKFGNTPIKIMRNNTPTVGNA